MKTWLSFLFIMINAASMGQSLEKNIQTIESKLEVSLPTDYKEFIINQLDENLQYYFPRRMDNWTFWSVEQIIKQTQKLKKEPRLNKLAVAFASNSNQQVLYYRFENDSLSNKIFLWDKELDWMFYAFSLSEFINYEKTQKLIDEIDIKGFKNQDISPILDCPGSLFWYAFKLQTSQYDDNFSPEKNQRALEIFFEIADKGHPDAAHEIASHYYFQDQVDINKVITWREKAIAYGSLEDVYELADFIIDERPHRVTRAIELLKSLLDLYWQREKAMTKLGRIYMRGTGGKLDYQKGIKYTKQCAELNNYNCLADLAFYYYKGKGVEKNVKKALKLLIKANEFSKDEEDETGFWEEEINKLKKELER